MSCWPGIATAMINCLFIELGTVTHCWFAAGSTSQIAATIDSALGWSLLFTAVIKIRVTSRQTVLIDTLNATRF